jgi:hypothetical protein
VLGCLQTVVGLGNVWDINILLSLGGLALTGSLLFHQVGDDDTSAGLGDTSSLLTRCIDW